MAFLGLDVLGKHGSESAGKLDLDSQDAQQATATVELMRLLGIEEYEDKDGRKVKLTREEPK